MGSVKLYVVAEHLKPRLPFTLFSTEVIENPQTLMTFLGGETMNLKAWRINKGMKQAEAAERLGISQVHYGRLENGESKITLRSLLFLFELFEVPIDQQQATMREMGLENILTGGEV